MPHDEAETTTGLSLCSEAEPQLTREHTVERRQKPVTQARIPRPGAVHREDESGNVELGSHEDKGKAIVLYNAFDTLLELDRDDDTIQGPTSSPIARSDD
ncbi:UNVERIFIED_CONTAM: hypothetical protein Sradi_7305200 [Sesamum radiatum]|uniref:Uncharacterized protein n=1 Tax=Sesamum radiatum TaxID=300843 RepID=A0AAW2I7Y0_SESRA